MNSEIGSEFWTGCTPVSNKEYTMRPHTIYGTHRYSILETLSGRTALEHIVEICVGQGKKNAMLPSYCCHTMIEPFMTHGMKVQFYDVLSSDCGIHREINGDNYDVILLMDYFGYTDSETLEIVFEEKEKGKTVIYDATHSMYSLINTPPCDYVYGSYRKWVDINCGFVAWKEKLSHGELTQNSLYDNYASLRETLFNKKAAYIRGDKVNKEDFLPLIEQAETILEEQYHHKMPDERSLNVLRKTDAGYIKACRKKNARLLIEAINEMNDDRVRCLTPVLRPSDVPLFVPVLVESPLRNSLRKHLINQQVYCPVHWPISKFHTLLKGSKQLFESEISLICDQRYGSNDMCRIVESIKDFLHKE